MKKPDEIKKGLECCINNDSCDAPCDICSYGNETDGCKNMMADALDYIQQLERQKTRLLEESHELRKDMIGKIEQLERELDAAVEDIRNARNCCRFCKYDDGMYCKSTPKPLDNSCFEWRGVKEEPHARD